MLVARLDSDGDVLLAGPAVRAVRAGCDELVMLVGPGGRAAAELLPGIDRVIVWNCPWITSPPPEVHPDDLRDLVDTLAGLELSGAVLLTSFHQSPLPLALLLRTAGVAPITGASVDYPGSLLDARLRPGTDELPEDQPEAERALAVAAAAGFPLPAGDDGRLAVREAPEVAALVGTEPYVVLHPGAKVPARCWPARRCAEAVRDLAAAGHRVLVTGAPSETALTAEVAGRHGTDLGGRTSFAELAGVLAGAGAVVVGNTGPAHLAAAVGTPVVSLFAPVVPAVRWAPYRVPTVLLGDQQAACRDTRARECPVPGHPCLDSVDGGQVVAAVGELIRAREVTAA